MKLTLQQLEAHLWGAANILRGKTAGQDYKNHILSLMFYKRLCDQCECEADETIAEPGRQQGRAFSEKEKAKLKKEVFGKQGFKGGRHSKAADDGVQVRTAAAWLWRESTLIHNVCGQDRSNITSEVRLAPASAALRCSRRL